MIESCGKWIKINSSDPISGRRENAARRRLRVCWRRVCAVSFVSTFSTVPFGLERKLEARSVAFIMYFHVVCSSEFFAVPSRRKSTRNLFSQATKLMVLMDHEFAGNSTGPPCAFLQCFFHMGISLPLGKQLIGKCLFITRHDPSHRAEPPSSYSSPCTSLPTLVPITPLALQLGRRPWGNAVNP